MSSAKGKMIDAFTEYFSMPVKSRPGMIYFVRAMEERLRKSDLSSREIANVMFLHHWAIHSNMSKLAFWILMVILYDDNLFKIVSSEARGSCDTMDLKNWFESCPYLCVTMNEVLRTHVAGGMMREITTDMELGGRLWARDKNCL